MPVSGQYQVHCNSCGESEIRIFSEDDLEGVERFWRFREYGVPEGDAIQSATGLGPVPQCKWCDSVFSEDDITRAETTSELPISNVGHRELVQKVMEGHGFDKLNDTQWAALNQGILDEGNHLLIAKTGNGKTFCAEAKIAKLLVENKRVIYLVPSHQLKSQKKEELKEWADAEILVNQRQNDAFQEADVVISTFEGFYKVLLSHTPLVSGYNLAVLDDFHYLYDSYRGFNLEKVITGLKRHDIDILAMSATIGSKDNIADWLDAELIESPEDRKIPIKESVKVRDTTTSLQEQIADLVSTNEPYQPFLVFNATKSDTESRAYAIAEERGWDEQLKSASLDRFSENSSTNRPGPPSEVVKEDLRDRMEVLPPSIERLADIMEWGVAYHHSDLPSTVKDYIEESIREGRIDCISATTTLASGFDAPIQTVIVADYSRWNKDEGTTEDMDVWEIEQWVGRAGRPGYGYNEGYAWICTKNEAEVEKYLSPRDLEEIQSHVAVNELLRKYLLEMIDSGIHTEQEIESYLDNTLYLFNSTKTVFGIEHDPNEFIVKNIRWLKDKGFIEIPRPGQLRSTELGSAAVDYGLRTYGRYKLTGVRKLYDWISDTEEFDQLELLEALSRFSETQLFDADELDMSPDFAHELEGRELEPESETARTAGVLVFFWCQGEPLTNASESSGMRAEYSKSVSRDILPVYYLAGNLLDIQPGTVRPEWWYRFSLQLKHGVSEDEARLVEQIDGLGRETVRELGHFAEENSALREGTLTDRLLDIFEDSDKGLIQTMLDDQVYDIGPKRSARITDYLIEQRSAD